MYPALDFRRKMCKNICTERDDMHTLSIAETRRDFCSLAAGIIDGGEPLVITRYGKPCLVVMRYSPEKVAAKPQARALRCENTPMFGMWADREDMADPREWIEKMRSERMKRIGLA